ncbi:MAG: glutaredoxin family protein [Candidatus Woesearchaeota archaeon]
MESKSIMMIVALLATVMLAGCNAESNVNGNAVSDTQDQTNNDDKYNAVDEIQEDPDKVQVYFFWGDGCPHCAKQKQFFEGMDDRLKDQVQFLSMETYKNPENAQLMQTFASAHGEQARGVPITFIGDEVWKGFAEQYGDQMVDKIEECMEEGCESPLEELQ